MGVVISYLLVRTWLTVKGRMPWLNLVWPYLDVVFVTIYLLVIRSPTDPLSLLYLIPLAWGVASLSLGYLTGIASFMVACYLLVVMLSRVSWTIGVVFHLAVVVALASLYGWIIRAVTTFERAAERAQYQTELAREIHDGIQHLLVTMGARLELAHRLIGETPGRASQIIAQERETTRRAADELRYLVRRLRPAAGSVELASALRLQVVGMADRWPFTLEVDVPSQLPKLDPAVEHTMLRVIQESLTNAAKHAQASQVAVRVSAGNGVVQCTIHDDGVGFDPASAQVGGLHGLQERVRAAGGTCEVRSGPGQGTTVTASFPLHQGQAWKRSAS